MNNAHVECEILARESSGDRRNQLSMTGLLADRCLKPGRSPHSSSKSQLRHAPHAKVGTARQPPPLASPAAMGNKSRQRTFRCCQQLYDLLSTTVQSSGRNWPAVIRRRSLPPAEGGRHVVAPAQSVKALVPHPKLPSPGGRGCRSHAIERVHEDLHWHRQPT